MTDCFWKTTLLQSVDAGQEQYEPRQNADISALYAEFAFARTAKYEQSRLRQKSSEIATFWLIVEKNPC